MTDPFETNATHPTEPKPEWKAETEALHSLLTKAADLADDEDITITGPVLEAGAFCECQHHDLHDPQTVQQVLRRARHQIARTITVLPHEPEDPLIDLVLDILSHHPPKVQARVLYGAARFPRSNHSARPPRTGTPPW